MHANRLYTLGQIILIFLFFTGPKGWPIVGNLYDMATKMQDMPFSLELVQKYGPVCKLSVGEFTCHAACVAIMIRVNVA